ncbi:MAG: site-2 protease family protein [Candidatus Diapherotrites archaeon]|nr:site-2 protease family protein [Candidatus Diapherotrites archaeon]
MGISPILILILVGIPVLEYLKRKGRASGAVIYTVPWQWLVRQVNKYAGQADWRVFGDIAITFLVGPIIARKIIDPKNLRTAYFWFFAYILFYAVGLPLARGGSMFGGADLITAAVQGAILILLGFAGYGIALLGGSAYAIIKQYVLGITPEPGIGLAIPGTSFGPIHIPLVEGIIALVIALLFHEGAHGVVALREGVPVDEGGVLLLGFLPIGAYVEPKEQIMKRKPTRSISRILAAGPMANMVVFAIFAVLLLAVTPLSEYAANVECTASNGVTILHVPESIHIGDQIIPSGAYGEINAGTTILDVNGTPTPCSKYFFKALAPLKKDEYNGPITLTVLENNAEKNVTIQMHSGYLGVEGIENHHVKPLPWWYGIVTFMVSLIYWTALLNFMIGLVNMLPVPPLDGGQLFRALAEKEGMKLLYKLLFWATIIVFVINALPWVIK